VRPLHTHTHTQCNYELHDDEESLKNQKASSHRSAGFNVFAFFHTDRKAWDNEWSLAAKLLLKILLSEHKRKFLTRMPPPEEKDINKKACYFISAA
jgi:hypothetical protein